METDVAIIGGGINGTGIARDLALRGVRVALFERRDFGQGATGNSSGLIHGGIRYLLHDVHTTKLSCVDSGYIQKIAPFMPFRVPLLLPVLNNRPRPNAFLSLVEVFFERYDRFQPLKGGRPHTRLSAAEALQLEPGLTPDIAGAVTTDEWGVDPYRLTVLNALDAHRHGAALRNYVEVSGFLREGTRILGVTTRDTITGRAGELRARVVFNATGPWAESVAARAQAKLRLRPGKGVHLVLDRRVANFGIICTAIDGRQVFLLPHGQSSIIGTTDDDYYGSLDHMSVTQDEVEYLLQAVQQLMPAIRQYRIVDTWVGARPTIFRYGALEDDLSRGHRVFDHAAEGADGLMSMAGGKLAAYRAMSEEASDLICKRLGVDKPCLTHVRPLPGGEEPVDAAALAREFAVHPVVAERLVTRHGGGARTILDLGKRVPGGMRVVCPCEPAIEAELRHACRTEWVRQPGDLFRRCHVGRGPCQATQCALRIGQIYAEETGRDAEMAREAVHELLRERWRSNAAVLERDQLAQAELRQGIYALSAGAFRHVFPD